VWRVVKGRIERFCEHYRGPKFHAVLCDPPYAYGFMGKEWDDQTAFRRDVWAAIAKLVHPGGFIMAFGGSRTYHRLAVAMEDSGLIVHPCIGWVNGQGFPKATRIDTQVDKSDARDEKREREYRFTAWMRSTGITAKQIDEATESNMGGHYLTDQSQPAIATADMFDRLRPYLPRPPQWVEQYVEQRTIESKTFAEREVIGQGTSGKTAIWNEQGEMGDFDITAPATDLARAWEGHRYGLQALKPALELVCVAQVPYEGKPVDSITGTGAGAQNIDAARVGIADGHGGGAKATSGFAAGYEHDGFVASSQGRWPPNFALVHNADCVRVGARKVKNKGGVPHPHSRKNCESTFTSLDYTSTEHHFAPDGTETVAAYDCAESCPVAEMGRQSGERQAGYRHNPSTNLTTWFGSTDGSHIEGERGYQDTGTAARFFPNVDYVMERIEWPFRYQAKAARKERDAGLDGVPLKDGEECYGDGLGNGPDRIPRRNRHPTVKPIALCRWLATLLLPPPEYAPRRILVPFAGSGSEMIGALLAGWDEVIGVEMMGEYVDIAKARLAYWEKQAQQGRLL